MKQKLQTLLALIVGILGIQAKAETRVIEIKNIQDLSGKYLPESFESLAQRGLLYSIDGSDKIYLKASAARKLIQDPNLGKIEPSTVELMKDLLGNSTIVRKKPLDGTILSTQDYRNN